MKDNRILEIKVQRGIRKIKCKDILYFSSRARIVIVHLIDGTEMPFYSKLDDVEKMLPEGWFLRCHQSFLVNADRISMLKREYLLLDNQQIPVSRSCYVRMRESGMIGSGFEKDSNNSLKVTNGLKVDAETVRYPGAILVAMDGSERGRMYLLSTKAVNRLYFDKTEFYVDYHEFDQKIVTPINESIIVVADETKKVLNLDATKTEMEVLVDGKKVESTIKLQPYQQITINNQLFLYVPICGEKFWW